MAQKVILALGPAGSNGHEAAFRAFRTIDPAAKWDWDICLCESNKAVLDRAIESGLYAIVPAENSVGGPVATIADSLFRTCSRDSRVRVIGHIDMEINHCLLARHDFVGPEPFKVQSHGQAFMQCSKFIAERGWRPIVEIVNSTSAAARAVALSTENSVCIASEFAAEKYKLQILERNIQDSPRNITRFAILGPAHELALMKKSLGGVTVAIIGVEGGYGKWLTAFFEHHGCVVRGVDTRNLLVDARRIAAEADVVLFSVPTLEAPDIIARYHVCSHERQLWLDVTSLKSDVMTAMLQSKAEVVGMHPLCAPPRASTFKGQTLSVVPGRVNSWGPWVASFLALLEAEIDIVEAEEHDYLVALRQALPHALMLIEAFVLREFKTDVKESLRVSSPFYRILLAAMCRMHHQNPKVYGGIQIGNPHVPRVLRALRDALDTLIRIVEDKSLPDFVSIFNDNQRHIGVETLKKGNEEFEFMNGLLADMSLENPIFIKSEKDHPGLLHTLLGIIAAHGVNMRSMHSRRFQDTHMFVMSLDVPTDSTPVKQIIAEINNSGLAKVILS